jgi:hypothetical protein
VNGQTRSDVFNKEVPVTWLGLDFTNAKLIGDRERFGGESDVRHLLEAWNALIVAEPDKYVVSKAIGRITVENAVEVTNEHNAELDVMTMFSDNEKDFEHINPSDVEQIVRDYDFKGKSGVGLMFIVESFSKINEEGSVYVTFINMDSKQVLLTERMVGEPKGFGMRNFWAGAINTIIAKMQKKDFKKWRENSLGQ